MSTGPTAGIRSPHTLCSIDNNTFVAIRIMLVCLALSIVCYVNLGPWGIILGIVPMYLILV